MRACGSIFAVVLAGLAVVACDSDLPGYVAKQGFHHGSLLMKAQSVDLILADPNIDPKTERYLQLSKEVLEFAASHGQRVGGSYRKYLKLHRDWVTQIVMSADKASLTPHLFHYPVVGDLPYRGFYDEDDAVRLEKQLTDAGDDVYRRKVEAFSTTGWLPDPIISTMLSDEGRFVELLFHELTHSTFYFADQADFNEAFASWMGYRLALEFANSEGAKHLSDRAALQRSLEESHQFQLEFAVAVKEIIAKGKEMYARPNPLEQREPYFAWIRERLKQNPRFARMAALPWNNAFILSLGTYYEKVGPIENYARAHGLTPAQFLAKVAATGPSIIPEITGF